MIHAFLLTFWLRAGLLQQLGDLWGTLPLSDLPHPGHHMRRPLGQKGISLSWEHLLKFQVNLDADVQQINERLDRD